MTCGEISDHISLLDSGAGLYEITKQVALNLARRFGKGKREFSPKVNIVRHINPGEHHLMQLVQDGGDEIYAMLTQTVEERALSQATRHYDDHTRTIYNVPNAVRGLLLYYAFGPGAKQPKRYVTVTRKLEGSIVVVRPARDTKDPSQFPAD